MRVDIPGKGLISFEGQTLPEAPKHFELACFWKNLSAEIKEWTLDLKYSWSRWRAAPSDLVLRGCEELEGRIYSEYKDLVAGLRKQFSEHDTTTICHEWISSINTIRTCAEKKDVCRWIISPLECEVQYFLGFSIRFIQTHAKTLEAGKFKFQYRDKTGKVIHSSEETMHREVCSFSELPPHFVEYMHYIQTATEEEQIAFLHQFTDCYSSPRPQPD